MEITFISYLSLIVDLLCALCELVSWKLYFHEISYDNYILIEIIFINYL